jgi:hypothetical protein
VITRDPTAIRRFALSAPDAPDFVAERDGVAVLFPLQNRNYSSVRDALREVGRSVAGNCGSL